MNGVNLYIIIDNRTGVIVERKRTMRAALDRVDALLATWVWTEGQLGIKLAK